MPQYTFSKIWAEFGGELIFGIVIYTKNHESAFIFYVIGKNLLFINSNILKVLVICGKFKSAMQMIKTNISFLTS